MTSFLHYFAYGSNMLPLRMHQRAPSGIVLAVAEIPGFALRFHKRGVDGSAKCNALYTGDKSQAVLGVIYRIRAGEKPALDRAESLGRGYNQVETTLLTGGRPLTVFTYVADPVYIDDSLKPFHWYQELVISGARYHRLPGPYVERIAAVAAVEDPDPARAREHLRLLPSR